MPRKTVKKIEEIETATANITLGNIIAIIVVIALVGLGAWGVAKYNNNRVVTPNVAAAQTLAYDCNDGQTVLSVLKDKAEIKTLDSDLGVYVDEINGTANDNGGFWIYYVNGTMGQVGVDQYQCKTGDKVEWRYEKLL